MRLRLNLDVPTPVATRGRDFPVGRLASMLRCLNCGSREIAVHIEPPAERGRARGGAGVSTGENSTRK